MQTTNICVPFPQKACLTTIGRGTCTHAPLYVAGPKIKGITVLIEVFHCMLHTLYLPTPQKQKVGQTTGSCWSRSIDILENLDDNSKITDLTVPLKSKTVGDIKLL